MRVKTTIKFEVEYPLSLEFYETNDREKALEMERACVAGDPKGIIDAFSARGNGSFTMSVERVDDNARGAWLVPDEAADGCYTIESVGTTEV